MRKRLIFSILIISIAAFAIWYYFLVVYPKSLADLRHVILVKEFVNEDLILFENQIKSSPNKKFYSYTTAKDLGLRENSIWLVDRFGEENIKLNEVEEYKYYSTPTWNSDSTKVAFLKYYAFEIWTTDLDGDTELIYSENDHLEDNVLFPSLSYAGETYLKWDGDWIEFENNKTIPNSIWAVNSKTKEVKKVRDVEAISLTDEIVSLPFFSQRDESWEEFTLGGCKEESIGSAGCAIASLSMLFNSFGVDLNPRKLNSFLSENQNQGYFEGCDVMWFLVQNYQPGVKVKGVYFNEFNFERIDYELNNGNYVIVGFDNVNFSNVPHWVVVKEKLSEEEALNFKNKEITHPSPLSREGTELTEMDMYLVNDPWTGEEKLLSYFGQSYDHSVVYEKEIAIINSEESALI